MVLVYEIFIYLSIEIDLIINHVSCLLSFLPFYTDYELYNNAALEAW